MCTWTLSSDFQDMVMLAVKLFNTLCNPQTDTHTYAHRLTVSFVTIDDTFKSDFIMQQKICK